MEPLKWSGIQQEIRWSGFLQHPHHLFWLVAAFVSTVVAPGFPVQGIADLKGLGRFALPVSFRRHEILGAKQALLIRNQHLRLEAVDKIV